MKVKLSDHVYDKLEILKERGFPIIENQVIDCLTNPDTILDGYRGRKIAQKNIDEKHLLRVVFEMKGDCLRAITVYPARRERYENEL